MAKKIPASDRIAELLVHVGRAARSEDTSSDLTAAQWTCLRFLARANHSTRTPSAFASFQATTRGTASQIIKSLEREGLIVRHKSPTDGRSVYFDLTEAGRAMLSRDPLGEMIGALDDFDEVERERFLATLSQLVTALAERRETRAFGTCSDCTHFTPSGHSGYCACMAAHLATEEINKLCASFSGQEAVPSVRNGASQGKGYGDDRG